MSNIIVENISKNLSWKYSQRLLDHAKQKKSEIDAIKTTSKRIIHKTVEAKGDLISNKIADKKNWCTISSSKVNRRKK